MELPEKKVVRVKPTEFAIELSDEDIVLSLQHIDRVKNNRMKEYKVKFWTQRWLDYRQTWLLHKFRILHQNHKLGGHSREHLA